MTGSADPRQSKNAARQQRLADELRENLKKRKELARQRRAQGETPSRDAEANTGISREDK